MKPELTIYSTYSLMRNWVSRIAGLVIISAGLYHYFENPEGLSILAIICFVIIVIINDEQISVYSSHFEQNKFFVFGLLKRKTIFEYKSIELVKIDNDENPVDKIVNDLVTERYVHEKKNLLELTFSNEEKKILRLQ